MYYGSRVTFRQLVQYGAFGVVVLVFALYTLFQARLLIIGPVITLTAAPAIVQAERVIELSGYASNIVTIFLNGEQIYTDKNGYFKEALTLENGYTIATLTGVDRYGRSTSLTKEFVYTAATDNNEE